jgi:hypothetical protein
VSPSARRYVEAILGALNDLHHTWPFERKYLGNLRGTDVSQDLRAVSVDISHSSGAAKPINKYAP